MLAGQAVDTSNVNNLKDILLSYNKITETCFNRCAATLNYKTLTGDEPAIQKACEALTMEGCVNLCALKHINGNQRLMMTFMDIQSKKQQLLYDESLKQQQEAAATAAATAQQIPTQEKDKTTAEDT